MIGVKNNSKEVLKGRYDGQDYEFPVGVTVAVHEEVARHILGFGEDNKHKALTRLGWLSNSSQYESAVKRLDDFQFLAADVKFDEKPENSMPKNVKDSTLHLPSKQQPIASQK